MVEGDKTMPYLCASLWDIQAASRILPGRVVSLRCGGGAGKMRISVFQLRVKGFNGASKTMAPMYATPSQVI